MRRTVEYAGNGKITRAVLQHILDLTFADGFTAGDVEVSVTVSTYKVDNWTFMVSEGEQ